MSEINVVQPDLAYPSWVRLVRDPLSDFERTILDNAPIVHNGVDALAVFRDRASREENEVSYGMGLDAQGHVLGLWEGGKGGTTSVDSSGSIMLRPAVALNATSMILAHNHPSGDATPSDGDWQVWWHIWRGARDIGIDLLDALVITPKASTSLVHEITHARNPKWLQDMLRGELMGIQGTQGAQGLSELLRRIGL